MNGLQIEFKDEQSAKAFAERMAALNPMALYAHIRNIVVITTRGEK